MCLCVKYKLQFDLFMRTSVEVIGHCRPVSQRLPILLTSLSRSLSFSVCVTCALRCIVLVNLVAGVSDYSAGKALVHCLFSALVVCD